MRRFEQRWNFLKQLRHILYPEESQYGFRSKESPQQRDAYSA